MIPSQTYSFFDATAISLFDKSRRKLHANGLEKISRSAVAGLSTVSYCPIVTMSKSILISSFTLTAPPAMLMGVIPKSLCFSNVDPL